MPLTRLLANAGLFQLGWFACVFGAQRPWLLLVAVACLLAHLLWIDPTRSEWRLISLTMLAGWLLDSTLLNLGLFDFAGAATVAPLWLALLWALFATTLRHCLAWTAQPWWRASLLGALGGPLSYLAGAELAGVGMPLGLWPSLLVLGLIWAALLPALHGLARWLERNQHDCGRK
jgi:hypothetical protein